MAGSADLISPLDPQGKGMAIPVNVTRPHWGLRTGIDRFDALCHHPLALSVHIMRREDTAPVPDDLSKIRGLSRRQKITQQIQNAPCEIPCEIPVLPRE
jgi:hypothetical protein